MTAAGAGELDFGAAPAQLQHPTTTNTQNLMAHAYTQAGGAVTREHAAATSQPFLRRSEACRPGAAPLKALCKGNAGRAASRETDAA